MLTSWRRGACRNDGGLAAMTRGVVIANPKGEAIQMEEALALDCFARQFAARSQ
ncbi:MAG: hypothetical protein LBT00_15915 [Spirochaetaceae bacterium]|nr:hypothetical protein [Spirochaetaceae bacterium]